MILDTSQQTLFVTNRWLEQDLRLQGHLRIAGIDEAGRGPLAGPVVAATVLLPLDIQIDGLDDSKRLSHTQRRQLFDVIHHQALAIGVGMIDAVEIDNSNILQAALRAMALSLDRVCRQLDQPPQLVLIDGNRSFAHTVPLMTVIKGDQRSQNVAAASVIAKVTRDQIMDGFAQLYPQYEFEQHKGYPTTQHKAALLKYGPSPVHRFSFRGVIHPDHQHLK